MTVYRRSPNALRPPPVDRPMDFAAIAMPPPWTADAPCASIDPAMFFPEMGTPGSPKRAKQVCYEQCPVREKCLEWALSFESQSTSYGIYGGLSPNERRRLLKERAS